MDDPESVPHRAEWSEPLFILRASDVGGPDGILGWVRRMAAYIAPAKLQGALDVYREFIAWQKAHPEQTRVPE